MSRHHKAFQTPEILWVLFWGTREAREGLEEEWYDVTDVPQGSLRLLCGETIAQKRQNDGTVPYKVSPAVLPRMPTSVGLDRRHPELFLPLQLGYHIWLGGLMPWEKIKSSVKTFKVKSTKKCGFQSHDIRLYPPLPTLSKAVFIKHFDATH